MTNVFTNFFRKITYCEELQTILKEEEILLQKYRAKFRQVRTHGGIVEFPPNLEFGEHPLLVIWKKVIYLHTESRKLSEITRLLLQEEQNLTKRDQCALKQLREKLDKRPIKLLIKEKCYCDGIFEGQKYKSLISELINDEIKFWEYLGQENRAIRMMVLQDTKQRIALYKEASRICELIKTTKSWSDASRQFAQKYYQITKYDIRDSFDYYIRSENKEGIRLILEAIERIEKDGLYLLREISMSTKRINNMLKASRPK